MIFWRVVGLLVFWRLAGSISRELGVLGHRFRDSFEVLEVRRKGLGDLWVTFGTPGWSLGAPTYMFHGFGLSFWKHWGTMFGQRSS